MFIQILQDLYENGADFVDISGEHSKEGEPLKDTLKLTVKPEYLSDYSEEDTVGIEQELDVDFSESDEEEEQKGFSDKNLDDLI